MASRESELREKTITKRPWVALLVASSSIFLMVLDAGIIAVALPEIRSDFDESKRGLINLGATSYLVALTSLLLLAGRLADRYGRRKLFLLGLAGTVLAALGAALAPTPEMFLLARTIQGVGAAALIPPALAMVLIDIPKEKQGAAVGLWGSIGATAAVLGPMASGSLIEFFGWRSTFAFMVLIGFLALIVGIKNLNESNDPEVPENLDLISVFSGVISIGALTLALLQGNSWGWFSIKILFLIFLLVIASCIFWVTSKRSKSPLLDLELFGNNQYLQATITAGFHQIAFFAFFFSVPILLSEVWGWSAFKTGFAVAPSMILSAFIQAPIGALCDRVGYRKLILLGGLVPTLGVVWWVIFIDLKANYLIDFLPGVLIIAIGGSMVGITTTGAALTVVAPTKLGIANATHQVARRFGSTIGVALAVGLGAGSSRLDTLANIKILWWLVAITYAMGSIVVWRSKIE